MSLSLWVWTTCNSNRQQLYCETHQIIQCWKTPEISPEFTSCIYILFAAAATCLATTSEKVRCPIHEKRRHFPTCTPPLPPLPPCTHRADSWEANGMKSQAPPVASISLCSSSTRILAPLPGPADMIKELAAWLRRSSCEWNNRAAAEPSSPDGGETRGRGGEESQPLPCDGKKIKERR